MCYDYYLLSEELKNEVSDLIVARLSNGETVDSIAGDLGVDSRSIRRWRDKECVPNGIYLELLRRTAEV